MVQKPVTTNLSLRKIKSANLSTTKNHRFEPFSQRIARLKIDIIRSPRALQLDEQDSLPSTSHFRNALDEWVDRNLSEDFTEFTKQVLPLSESLPQILHHEQKVIDLLLGYIENGKAVSLEPLLDLVSHFAHDLGLRFEKYFERTVSIVSELAARHQDVQVIEWAFNCLAWLFKYLSRLLVPDLRPVYNLMARLLGKERQRSFVARFAAESMSFLMRKASSYAKNDRQPLEVIVDHILTDLLSVAGKSNAQLYEQGLTVLFSESIKGSQGGLHSGGSIIFEVLLSKTRDQIETDGVDATPIVHAVEGVVISLLHHTSGSHSFKPILEIVLANKNVTAEESPRLLLQAQLLLTIVGVRNASISSSWSEILDHTVSLLSTVCSSRYPSKAKVLLLQTFAVAHQNAPLNVAIAHVKFLETFASESHWRPYFLGFCSFYGDLGKDRFKDMLLPHFKKFILAKWSEHKDQLCIAIPRFTTTGFLGSTRITLPTPWQANIVSNINDLYESSPSTEFVYYCNGLLALLRTTRIEHETESAIFSLLEIGVESVLRRPHSNQPSALEIFTAGKAFETLVVKGKRHKAELWPIICAASSSFKPFHIFWQAVLAFIRSVGSSVNLNNSATETLVQALMTCLASPSHQMRLTALQILEELDSQNGRKGTEILQLAISIASTTPSVETIRTISMHLRNLVKAYGQVDPGSWVFQAVPHFCVGLLHVRLAPMWNSVCEALKDMCSKRECEEVICNIVFKWLQDDGPHHIEDAPELQTLHSQEGKAIHSNPGLNILPNRREDSFNIFVDSKEQLKITFDQIHAATHFATSFNRTQALKVLQAIPRLAEKRSRILVPILLQWALDADISDTTFSNSASQQTQTDVRPNNHWSRKDQKTMLSIFTQVTNPKVLYKSSEVYSALLSLLSHGDADIQKHALRAIFTWKNPVISLYEEQLLKFLDEAKFKEQLSVFLDVDSEDDSLQDAHRTDILPLLFRLIYGRIITRGKGDQQSNRRAVFVLLSQFDESDIRQFLCVVLGRLNQLSLVEDGELKLGSLDKDLLDQRRQLGLINMLYDLLDTWKATGTPFAAQLVDPVMYCLIRSANDKESTESELDATENSKAGLARSIRQISLRCAILLFDIIPNFDWMPYMPILSKKLITPRLSNLAQENTQAVSGLLRLFSVWSRHLETVCYLSDFDDQLLSKLAECISNSTTKDVVRRFVVKDIFGNLVACAENIAEGSYARALVAQHAGILIHHLGIALKADPSKELLEDGVKTIVSLTSVVPPKSTDVISTLQYLLLQPSKKVSPPTKTNILRIILKASPSVTFTAENFDNLYDAICLSFAYFLDRDSRALLCDILQELEKKENALIPVASLCYDLNSFASNRVDEPDYERRIVAFNHINEQMYEQLDARQWKAVLQNMLFYVKEMEELVIRASAGQALRRFVDATAQSYSHGPKPSRDTTKRKISVENHDNGDGDEFIKMLDKIVLASIEKGFRDQPELVCAEYLSIVAHAINRLPSWPAISGMSSLTGADDESSFFNNILHIQQHRRVRALKRLTEEVGQGRVASNNLAHFIIPLVERFVFDTESRGNVAGEVVGEAVRTIGILLQGLDWNQFNSVMRRYIGDIKRKPEIQETMLKLVDGAVVALSQCTKQKYPEIGDVKMSEGNENIGGSTKYGDEKPFQLQQTLPSQEKLNAHLLENVLPALETFLREKDDSVVSCRTMAAVIAARIISLLPKSEFQMRLPAILLDTCNILRSKDPVSRDAARKALGSMCQIIGPSSISFVLRALRSVLQRGFHLHVLSFTVHSILVTVTPELKIGDLDYCASDIVAIVMDDIFGNVGQEKEELEFLKDKASKKEVKQKKSFDTMQLLASAMSLPYLIDLIRPLELLLLENLTQKMLRDVDELLRRIELGLMQNPSVKDRDVLKFCHELIIDMNNIFQSTGLSVQADGQKRTSKYLIRKVHTMAHQRLNPQARISKIVRFGLELVRSVFRKHKDLASPVNVAGFLPIIGDAVIDDQEDLKLAAFRLFTQIVKVPLPRIDRDAPVYVAEAVKVVEGSEGLEREELPAAALKLVAAVLREKPSVTVKDGIVSLLLKQLRPDLQVKNQQGSAFTLLKAIIARKVIVPEIYELIDGDDGIASISIRDHDRTTRDLARGVWFQFLLDYPQAKGRFKKQLSFLAANLQYEHAEGRQSVMETLHSLLTRIGDDLLEEVISFIDWSLVSVMVNDEDENCREMASKLVKSIISRANEKWTTNYLAKLRWMLEQENNLALRRTALQCWSLYLEVKSEEMNDVQFIQRILERAISPRYDDSNTNQWELVFYALHTLRLLCDHRPEVAFSSKSALIWDGVCLRINYPHSWVKHESAKLIGLCLNQFAENGFNTLPLVSTHGLTFDEIQLRSLAARNLRLLKIGISKQFADQIADNLTLLGACFATSGLEWARLEVTNNRLNNDDSDDETEFDNEESDPHTTSTGSALEYLFQALSGILRREPKRTRDDGEMLFRRAESLIPRHTALNVLAKLVEALPPESFSPILDHVLLPLIHLTDSTSSVPFSSDSTFLKAHQELVDTASELMDYLQKILGTTEYVKVLQRVKRDVQIRREERRKKRKIEAVALPELAERLKKKKRASEKLRRREKGLIAKGRRRGW